jgi:hypothetical protein
MTPVYYVGTSQEVAHHARPLEAAFDVRIVSPADVVRFAQPGEMCVFFNEYYPRFRDACVELKEKGCPTLYAIDGILEWRNSWETPENSDTCLWVMRPALSHKVACIGRSQARVLESWGNLGKCEVVGVPRFDGLMNRTPRAGRPEEPLRILVLTAKCPGFTPEQTATTIRSLTDLKRWFETHPSIGSTAVEPVWRVTRGLEQVVGVQNRLQDTTGTDLASALSTVDAVIATPSTAMLEGMLQGVPVALLDYHNRPHYVPAAWRITAEEQVGAVIRELVAPSPAAMLYQDSILHDALECRTAATPRLVQLIEKMHAVARECLADGKAITYPRRLLADPQDGHQLPETRATDERLFPARLLFTGNGRCQLPEAAIATARFEGSCVDVICDTIELDLPGTEELLARQPASGRSWRDVSLEFDAHWHRMKTLAADDATKRLQKELELAQRELVRLRRRAFSARLARLGNKIRRLMPLGSTYNDH